MMGIKGGSVGIYEPDTIVDEPRVVDADSKNSGILVATIED